MDETVQFVLDTYLGLTDERKSKIRRTDKQISATEPKENDSIINPVEINSVHKQSGIK